LVLRLGAGMVMIARGSGRKARQANQHSGRNNGRFQNRHRALSIISKVGLASPKGGCRRFEYVELKAFSLVGEITLDHSPRSNNRHDSTAPDHFVVRTADIAVSAPRLCQFLNDLTAREPPRESTASGRAGEAR
jgi:hypothetical protein